MQDGDLATWEKPRIMLVLEDTLAHITGAMKRSLGHRKAWTPNDPEEWEWGLTTLKTIQRYAYNSVPVDVVTFVSPTVADLAGSWMWKYDIEIAACEYYDLRAFQRSLIWRRGGIQRVVDTDPERVLHYGQLGYQTIFNAEF